MLTSVSTELSSNLCSNPLCSISLASYSLNSSYSLSSTPLSTISLSLCEWSDERALSWAELSLLLLNLLTSLLFEDDVDMLVDVTEEVFLDEFSESSLWILLLFLLLFRDEFFVVFLDLEDFDTLKVLPNLDKSPDILPANSCARARLIFANFRRFVSSKKLRMKCIGVIIAKTAGSPTKDVSTSKSFLPVCLRTRINKAPQLMKVRKTGTQNKKIRYVCLMRPGRSKSPFSNLDMKPFFFFFVVSFAVSFASFESVALAFADASWLSRIAQSLVPPR